MHIIVHRLPWDTTRMLRWRVGIADFETLGGSLKFEYNKGALHHVPDVSRAPVSEVPELTEAEEELWIASKVLVQNSNSGEVKVSSKAVTRQEEPFHLPDVESIVAQILKWQAEDDYAQAGIKYCCNDVFFKRKRDFNLTFTNVL